MMGGDMMNSSSHSMGGMPVGPMPASAGGVPAHTTLFVGNISAGVTDPWLHSLLGVSGVTQFNKEGWSLNASLPLIRCAVLCGPLRG